MKIYRISISIQNDETGVMPQVDFNSLHNNKNNVIKYNRYKIKELKELDNIPNLILNTGSKRTDYVDTFALSGAYGKLISEQMYTELLKNRLPNYESIQLLLKDNKLFNYYFIDLIPEEIEPFISFKDSKFELIPGHIQVRIKNHKDFLKINNKYRGKYLTWKHLKLNDNPFDKFDIIQIGHGDLDWYTTKKVAEEFDKFSGLQIEEVSNIRL